MIAALDSRFLVVVYRNNAEKLRQSEGKKNFFPFAIGNTFGFPEWAHNEHNTHITSQHRK